MYDGDDQFHRSGLDRFAWLLFMMSAAGCTTPPLNPAETPTISAGRAALSTSPSVANRESVRRLPQSRWNKKESKPAGISSEDSVLNAARSNRQAQQGTPGAKLEHRKRSGSVRLASNEEVNDGKEEFLSDDPVAAPDEKKPTLSERLQIPQDLPGATAPALMLPPSDPDRPERRTRAIEGLFPESLGAPPITLPALTTNTGAFTLSALQELALGNNPQLVQVAGDIEAAEGKAIQAGLYPNPAIGYEADTVGSGGTANYHGVLIMQKIITAGKLELAEMAGNYDFFNAQLDLRKTRADLLADVRDGYFAVLVAQENLRYTAATVRLTEEIYRIQVDLLKSGQAAAYEPMQLRTFAEQARVAHRQAQNRYTSAWRQLAAIMGVPDLPPTAVDPSPIAPGSRFDYDAALQFVLNNHTDIQTAYNLECKARVLLRLAEVTPIPNVDVYSAIQRDFTNPQHLRTTWNLQVAVPVPIFDRNQGGIQAARGDLVRATRQGAKVRNDLSQQLAEAYERYDNNRVQLDAYVTHILPDQVRTYRGVYERHQQESDQVGFGDVVVAQQNMLAAISGYVSALRDYWAALADLSGLLQVDDLQALPLAPDIATEPPPAPAVENP